MCDVPQEVLRALNAPRKEANVDLVNRQLALTADRKDASAARRRLSTKTSVSEEVKYVPGCLTAKAKKEYLLAGGTVDEWSSWRDQVINNMSKSERLKRKFEPSMKKAFISVLVCFVVLQSRRPRIARRSRRRKARKS